LTVWYSQCVVNTAKT